MTERNEDNINKNKDSIDKNSNNTPIFYGILPFNQVYLIPKDPKLNTKFSNKLLEHGFYRDNSIQAETLRKKRQELYKINHDKKIEKLQHEFRIESNKIKNIQKKLARKQKRNAQKAIIQFSVMIIQSAWRGFCARKARIRLRRWRAATLIYYRLWFLREYTLREKAALIVQKAFRKFMGELWLEDLMLTLWASKTIQRIWRGYLARKERFLLTIVRKASKKIVKGVLLYGAARAIDAMQRPKWAASVIERCVLKYLRRKRVESLRKQKLKSGPRKRSGLISTSDYMGRRGRRMRTMGAIPTTNKEKKINLLKTPSPTKNDTVFGTLQSKGIVGLMQASKIISSMEKSIDWLVEGGYKSNVYQTRTPTSNSNYSRSSSKRSTPTSRQSSRSNSKPTTPHSKPTSPNLKSNSKTSRQNSKLKNKPSSILTKNKTNEFKNNRGKTLPIIRSISTSPTHLNRNKLNNDSIIIPDNKIPRPPKSSHSKSRSYKHQNNRNIKDLNIPPLNISEDKSFFITQKK